MPNGALLSAMGPRWAIIYRLPRRLVTILGYDFVAISGGARWLADTPLIPPMLAKIMPDTTDQAADQAADRELDARGLNCPLPVLRAKQALRDMAAGEVLAMVCTDPGSAPDLAALCAQTGHQLLASFIAGDEFHFRLKKS